MIFSAQKNRLAQKSQADQKVGRDLEGSLVARNVNQ